MSLVSGVFVGLLIFSSAVILSLLYDNTNHHAQMERVEKNFVYVLLTHSIFIISNKL